jgi:excisionase family DNA binding protein
MLNIGRDRLYELMRDRTIRSYLDGGKRQIDLASVEEYHASMLENSKEFRLRSPHGAA